MIPGQRTFAGLRLADRNAMLFGKSLERLGATFAVQHTAPGDQERPLSLLENVGDGVDFERLGLWLAEMDDTFGEKLFRPIGRRRLDILRQRERHRAALRRVGQHGNGARQGGQELVWRDDAIKVTRNGAQTIDGRDVTVLEVFDLLQDGVGCARDKDVAREQQDRQAIDVRRTSGRHEIRTPRPDRRRDRHHAATEMRLGISDGGQRHALLVVRAVGREGLLDRMQRFPQTGHVAMPEDRPDAAKQRLHAVLRKHLLRRQVAHQRLRHR